MECRVFGYAGKSSAEVEALFAKLKEASRCDPFVTAAFGADCTCHGDGWGYVLHSASGLTHYRSHRAIYADDVALPRMTGEIRAVFHTRLASKKAWSAHIFSHPFFGVTCQDVWFLAHNGSLEVPGLSAGVVDSEHALDCILARGDLEKALPAIKQATASAANLLVLRVPRAAAQAPEVSFLNYFTPKKPKLAEKNRYYQMYQGRMKQGRAVFSSTFTLGPPIPGLEETTHAPFGQWVVL